MTSTEEATEAADKVLAEVAAELGPDRITALRLMAQARGMEDAAGILAVHADLADAARQAQETLREARAAREAAEDALAPPREAVERLEAELADCRQRTANIIAAHEDDDLTVRLESRSLRVACEEEIQALTARIAMIGQTLMAPLAQELTAARAAEDRAGAAAAALVEADEDPLTHPRARRTAGHDLWMSQRWPEILNSGDPRTPGWGQARRHLMALLKASGIGQELETRAIEAFRAGDPAAVQAGGANKTWPDGTSVTYEPGKPPVVYTGRASAPQLAAAPAAPPVDTTPASAVMAQAWAGIRHQTSPGLYVHH